jgi:opacity protein-like surface antigen
MNRLAVALEGHQSPLTAQVGRITTLVGLLLIAAPASTVLASEDVAQRPFAYWADVPDAGQFVLGMVYEQAKSYTIYANGQRIPVKVESGGENYGIDVRQGYLALQYGLTDRWALDLEAGGTTVGWRAFSPAPGYGIQSTIGIMDISLGARYQIFNEAWATNSPWLPTLTFRAGGIVPGTYSQSIAFAPGFRSAGIEPEILARKHFGWTGFGAYGDALYRWNMTTENDNMVLAVGFFQQIKGWELDVGYEHLQTFSGGDITFTDPNDLSTIQYPRAVREISESILAGFSYTTAKRHWKYGFHSRIVVAGNNTDLKPWLGASIDIPIGGKSAD